jgi:ADP-ribose pyrophosphatase
MRETVKKNDTQALASADPHLVEKEVQSTQVYSGHFLKVQHDKVELPDGTHASREFIVHPGAVMVVPVLDDGHLVVERQYRYPLRRSFIEFPAGKRDPNESGWACAVRELQEETGYVAREWARAGLIHNAIAYSTEGIEIWFARGLTPGVATLDKGEFLEVQTASEADLLAQVQQGSLTDVKTIVGLMWLQKWREGAWPLTWAAAH